MTQYSGIFTTTQQMQAIAGSGWPSPPDGNYVFFGGFSGSNNKVYIASSSNGTSFTLTETGYTTSSYEQVSGIAFSESLGIGVVVLTKNSTGASRILTFNSSGTIVSNVGSLSNFMPVTVANTGPNDCFYKDGYFYIIGTYNTGGDGLVVASSPNGTTWTKTTLDTSSGYGSPRAAACMTKTADGYFIVCKLTSSSAVSIYAATTLDGLSSNYVSYTPVAGVSNLYLGGVAGKAGKYVLGLKSYTDTYAGSLFVATNVSSSASFDWTISNNRTIFTSDGCFNTNYYGSLDLFYYYGGASQAVYSSSDGTTLSNLTGSAQGYAFSGTYSQTFNKIFRTTYNNQGIIYSAPPSSSSWTQVLAGNSYTWGVACSSVKG